MPAIRTKTGTFMPGVSGNPSGRPRRTAEQREAMEQIKELAQDAPEILRKLMHSPKTAPALKLRCAEIVLDRIYGKPRQNIDAAIGSIDYSNADVIHFVDEDKAGTYIRMTDAQAQQYAQWCAEHKEELKVKVNFDDD